jgi:serine/threonine protein phosphatase PrpC
MSEKIKFRLAARCGAAGRPNNEDNFQVDADLSADQWEFQRDKVVSLGDKGALLLVCDGMGGMNAGEVASNIAVETVKQRFSNNNLAHEALVSDEQRCDFIRRVIQEADANIKREGKADPSKSGMGSTIVLAWLIDGKVYVGWCGDSRAYKYNPQRGFVQLSHDHSYVQELVDSGKLSPELAFDHPNNNIITRSLGDPRGAAQPDVKIFPLEENDVILLCSDGLSGVLRDNEMEKLIADHQNSMDSCCHALWEAAKNAGWHDNVTIALAQIMPQQAQPAATAPVIQPSNSSLITPKPVKAKIWKNKYFKICCAAAIALLVGLTLVLLKLQKQESGSGNTDNLNECKQLLESVTPFLNMTDFYNDSNLTIIQDCVINNINKIKNIPCDTVKAEILRKVEYYLSQTEQNKDDLSKFRDELIGIKTNLR